MRRSSVARLWGKPESKKDRPKLPSTSRLPRSSDRRLRWKTAEDERGRFKVSRVGQATGAPCGNLDSWIAADVVNVSASPPYRRASGCGARGRRECGSGI